MNSNAEKFWYNWLKVAAAIVILFGVLMTLLTYTNGIKFMDTQIAKVFQLSPEFMVDIASLQNWMVGVIGATTAGWGITLMYLILIPLKRKEKWAWNAIMISLIVLFTLDTYISTYYGAKFNVILNIAFLMQFVAPLLFIQSTIQNTPEHVTKKN